MLRDIGHLLPTPQACDGSGGRLNRNPETLATGKRPSGVQASKPLATAVDQLVNPLPLLATPTAESGAHPGRRKIKPGQTPHLSAQVGELLPTPTARDGKGSGQNPQAAWEASRLTGIEHRDNPTGSPSPLLPTPNASDGPKGGPNRADGQGNPYLSGVKNLLPTPTSQAAKHGETVDTTASGHGYNLWDLRESSGGSMGLPSPAGRTPSDGQHPGQLTIADA